MLSQKRERERSGGERETFFFLLIERDLVIQCYLTAQLMLSEGGESSPCPICQSVGYEKSRHTVPLIHVCLELQVCMLLSVSAVLMKY